MNNLLLNIFMSPYSYIKYDSYGQYVNLDEYFAYVKPGSKEEKIIDPVIHQITQRDIIRCLSFRHMILYLWDPHDKVYKATK